MATNHTQELAICDALAAEFLWKHKRKTKISSAVVKQMATEGIISMSNLLERILLDNGKLLGSNEKGEDFTDGSDAKYLTARLKKHSVQSNGRIVYRNFATLPVSALKNKRGALRVMITFHHDATNTHKFLMFLLPYKVWKKAMCSTGLHFYFSSKDNGLTKKTSSWAGKYQVHTVKQLAA
jgi:hypothetical protein